MTRTIRSNLAFALVVLTIFVLLTGLITPDQNVSAQQPIAAPGSPVLFIENEGQFPSSFRFQVPLAGPTLSIASDGLWYTLIKETTNDQKEVSREGVNLKVSFEGANSEPVIEPINRLETVVSYFHGSDPENWQADVPVWGGVRYKDLYPGIDLEVTSQDGALLQRLVTRAGADLDLVKMKVEGADSLALRDGKLLATTAAGEFNLPLFTVSGVDSALPAASLAGETVSAPFAGTAGDLEKTQTFAGSADLLYSTFFGGDPSEYAGGVFVDSSDNIYFTGETGATWGGVDIVPTPGVFDPNLYNSEIFVVKFSPTYLVTYITFLGGKSTEQPFDITADASGNAFVTGTTSGINGEAYPTTTGAYDTTTDDSYRDVVISKINATGTALLYSTFIGADGKYDVGNAVAVDDDGDIYVAGETEADAFPTTAGAFQTTYGGGYNDCFLLKLSPDGAGADDLVYSTFLGGSAYDVCRGIAINDSGEVYTAGVTESSNFPITVSAYDTSLGGTGDGFVAKLNAAGSALGYATFLGGESYADAANAIDIDSLGNAYVTGYTVSSQFPTTSGAFDTSMGSTGQVYVTKFNPDGTGLIYSTFVGGDTDWQTPQGLRVDSTGSVFVSGVTPSTDFPTTYGAFDTTFGGSGGYHAGDAYLFKLNPSGSALNYSTYIGGTDDELVYSGTFVDLDSNGDAILLGETRSSEFPVTAGAYDSTLCGTGTFDLFLAKLDIHPANIPAPTLTSPEDNATVDGTPTYSWQSIFGATAYRFQYDDNDDFSSPVFTSGDLTGTSFSPPTQAAGVYYWRVKARDAGKNWSEWSTRRKVTVTVGTPLAPVLISPAAGIFTKDNTPTLSWKSAKYGYKYQVQVNTSSTFPTASMKLNKTLGVGVLTTNATTLVDGKYYWRVRAKNSLGTFGPWSKVRAFTIDTVKPPAPKLSSPANNAVLASMPYFKWLASTGGFYYSFQLSTDTGFTDLVYYDNKIFGLQCLPPPLGAGIYYWRVRAVDKAGNQSVWSAVRKLTIE